MANCNSQRLGACSVIVVVMLMAGLLGPNRVVAQGLGGAGTVRGILTDPSGAVVPSIPVILTSPVSGFRRDTTTDAAGRFSFSNLPPNAYHLQVIVGGFEPMERDVEVRTPVPIELGLALAVAGTSSEVEVVGHVLDLLERDPTAHTDVDQTLVARLPIEATGGLNQVITLASPGVVADANGFFHPIGDHAQTQFSIDNQPVTDQQSRIYSNQVSANAVQSMEIINGVPPAEFGDKNSLVVRMITKSGLAQKRSGTVSAGFGSFSTPVADFSLGVGDARVGNFVSYTGTRSDRFLDPPEFEVLHGDGHSHSLFDRVDFHPSDNDTLRLNVHVAKSAFDVPNTYDQAALGQDQHQEITTVNIAPGYTRVLSSKLLLTANGFVRRDHVTYDPSADPFADTPGTVSQDRRLTNIGGKVDLAYAQGRHNVKGGALISHTALDEQFALGLTDPGVNSPCVDADGAPVGDAGLVSPDQCVDSFTPNEEFLPGLLPFDLSRGGRLFDFTATKGIDQQAFYAQDGITLGQATVNLGLRFDHYDGFVSKSLFQPRVGISYSVPRTNTILRASYGRTLETPYNENLILSSTADPAIFGTSGIPLPPGVRDHVEVGVQQAFGRWVVADVGYFDKRTDNAYDFGTLFDTPIFFPVSWDHSHLYGLTARINLVEYHGFSAFTVMGHTNAIFYPPGTGGLLVELPESRFRIDHDQKFQQTTNLQYQFLPSRGAWVAWSWRYDSGLVAGAVPDYATALTLTADQQSAIGLFCGSTFATLTSPITSCDQSNRGATRYRIPADGTADDYTNPPRIAPRHLFDLGVGSDNLLRTTRTKVKVRFSVLNLTNEEALYNFLSTFSGTHFVTPRSYQVQVGVTF